MIRTLDIDLSTQTSSLVGVLSLDQGSKIQKKIPYKSEKLYCLFAYMEKNSNPFTKKFTSFKVTFQHRHSTPFVFIVASIMLGVVLYCISIGFWL